MVNVTALGDIAGQVTAKSQNADRVTVGGVCLPTGGLTAIRNQIPVGFPKWRNASDANVEFIVNLLVKEVMASSTISIDKRTDQWQNFWQDAGEVHSKTASLSGGSISFIKAANQIKYLLFTQSTALAITHSIKIGTIPRVLNRRGQLLIQSDVVFDNDIQGDENVDAFAGIWRSGNLHQPLTNSLGIEITTKSLRITTEQNEPLLLMADYLAGIFQAANSESNTLECSRVSVFTAERAHQRLLKARNFHELSAPLTMSYADIFPEFSKYLRRDAL